MQTVWQHPQPEEVWKAIEIYLSQAYPAQPPLAVRNRLEILRAASSAEFYLAAPFECSPAENPTKYCLRLGNRVYPHMKLVIESSPDGRQTLYRADTHDQHVQAKPDSPDAKMFADLTKMNQEIAQRIEKNWDDAGLMTFKRYLREDLEKRVRGRAPHSDK